MVSLASGDTRGNPLAEPAISRFISIEESILSDEIVPRSIDVIKDLGYGALLAPIIDSGKQTGFRPRMPLIIIETDPTDTEKDLYLGFRHSLTKGIRPTTSRTLSLRTGYQSEYLNSDRAKHWRLLSFLSPKVEDLAAALIKEFE